MPRKKVENYKKYNEFAPKCTVCKHYQRVIDIETDEIVHVCNAKFNKGALIFAETALLCDENNAFKEK